MAAATEPLTVEQIGEIIPKDIMPKSFSLVKHKDFLSPFFRFSRALEEEKSLIFFFHKTVKEWLLGRDDCFKQKGNKLMADACLTALQKSDENSTSLESYALRNAIYHVGSTLKSVEVGWTNGLCEGFLYLAFKHFFTLPISSVAWPNVIKAL